jgi:hypothetical protein
MPRRRHGDAGRGNAGTAAVLPSPELLHRRVATSSSGVAVPSLLELVRGSVHGSARTGDRRIRPPRCSFELLRPHWWRIRPLRRRIRLPRWRIQPPRWRIRPLRQRGSHTRQRRRGLDEVAGGLQNGLIGGLRAFLFF